MRSSLVGVLVLLGFALSPAAAETIPHPAYVGSETCAECHQDQVEDWRNSHHGLAWTLPNPDTVVGDFDGTRFDGNGMTARFRLEDGEYFSDVTESDGSQAEYKIHSVVGIEPLQQYLVETDDGRLQSFDVVWDAESGGWYHLYPDQILPPSDGLHWTGPYKNWNGRCAECHATGFQKNYDPLTRRFNSTQAEIGVGCEACHGPGEAHIAWAEGKAMPESEADLDTLGFVMRFGAGDVEADIQQCAGCHARREPLGDGNPLPGTPFHDAYRLSLLTQPLYHADGQIRDEVYVYGSFLQSKMYEAGVSCMNCHDAHTAELKAEGNGVCTQCHSPAGNPDFPTLKAGLYDDPAHHFHPMGSEGAECKSCHMPESVYMGIDWRADHSFRIPRPDLSRFTGAPDACTGCHEDQTAEWAAEQIAGWYPDSDNRQFHYGLTLARGEENPANARESLLALIEDDAYPAIVRATAMNLLEPVTDPEVAERMEPFLTDAHPLLRAGAATLQRGAAPQDRVPRIINLLSDPMKSVRLAAVRQMLDAPIARLPDRYDRAFKAALAEWQDALITKADFPETQMAIAGTALVQRNFEAAAAAFREAVALDPQLVQAWVMVVRIAAALEGVEAARAVVGEALAANPGDPNLEAMARELAVTPE